MIQRQIFVLCATLLLLTGCTDGPRSDLAVRPINIGLTANIQANLHEGGESVDVVAAVFQDGVRINLIGGDVFEANTTSQGVLLDSVDVHTGDYAGILPLDYDNEQITVSIQHKPVEARQGRWYPVDILTVDPGQGEYVGRSATVFIPTELDLLGPFENAIYISRDDVIDITWVPGGAGDSMRLSASVTCNNTRSALSYGLTYDVGDDDGQFSIGMNKLAYNDTLTALALAFSDHISRVFFAAVVDVLSLGLIDVDEIKNTSIDIETADCDIGLMLIREREGELDVEFDGGQAIGSTSASTKILYRPNGL